MTLSELSIRRPVLASVVCLLIVVFGIASLQRIPVRELPNVDRSVVSVTTSRSSVIRGWPYVARAAPSEKWPFDRTLMRS